MKKWLLIIVLIIILAILIYPKNCGWAESPSIFGYPGKTIKSEQCKCLGLKLFTNFYPFGLPKPRSNSSSGNYDCLGIPLGKVCYEKTILESGKSENWKQVSCS